MKKGIWLYTVLLIIFIVIAGLLAVATFSEQEIEPAHTYTLSDAAQPTDGIIVRADSLSGSNESLLGEWQGRQNVAEWKEDTVLQWHVNAPAAGEYELAIGYYPLQGNGQPIEFFAEVNGEAIGNELVPLELGRIYQDEPGPFKRSNGNELRPKQIEGQVWLHAKVRSSNETETGSLKLQLKQGDNIISLRNVRESAAVDYIQLTTAKQAPSYEQYASEAATEGAAPMTSEASGKQEQVVVTVQAEHAYAKSDAGLYPTIDRTSPLTTPYHPSELRVNTIGASNWEIPGQWISWKVDVPADGWYKIGARYHQSKVKGTFVSRKLEIDGQVLFDGMESLRFPYSLNWNIQQFGESGQSEPYLFYLTKGEHEIKLEVTLGDLAPSIDSLQDIVYELNQIYRKIVMITGMNPDPYRDYEIEKSIPELSEQFQNLSDRVQAEANRLDEMAGQSNSGSRSLRILARQLDSFIDRPDGIPKRLTNFKSNVTAVADWLLTVTMQPLELDYLYIASPDAGKPKAEASLAAKALHEVRAFAGSFLQNYDSMETKGTSDESIKVWIGLGRDQAYVLKRMIDESFVPETGIGVDLNLVATSLVTAVMAGQGPDVNLFTSRGDSMNLAFRGALEPLEQYEGFAQITPQYKESAFVPYQYQGHTFGIPDDQEFFMMFYRKDVLEELGLTAPQTWDDVMKIAPVLQNNNMGIGLPYENLDAFQLLTKGIGALNLFPTLLMQSGSTVYNEEQTATRLGEPAAYQAFKQWTDFYNLYDYALYKDDLSRFRTGEMPIIISSYRLYNRLAAVAPEITGTWEMVPIPGIVQEDGSINRTSGATGTASVMLKDTENKEAAWKFLQWWNSPEVQAQFVNELENEMGVLGRRLPANVDAVASSAWSRTEQTRLNEQWDQIQEIPELPGGYYTLRNIDNAFREVVFQKRNARETLFYWNKDINEEIDRKRYEFGVKQ